MLDLAAPLEREESIAEAFEGFEADLDLDEADEPIPADRPSEHVPTRLPKLPEAYRPNPALCGSDDVAEDWLRTRWDLVVDPRESLWHRFTPTQGCWVPCPEARDGEFLKAEFAAVGRYLPRGEKPKAGEENLLPSHREYMRHTLFGTPAGRAQLAQSARALAPAVDMTASEVRRHLWAGNRCWDLTRGAAPAADVDPATPHARSAAVAPRPGAAFPRFQRFLDACLPADHHGYFWQLFGHAVSGENAHTMGVLYGETGSGKSSIARLMSLVLGTGETGYAGEIDDTAFNGKENQFASLDRRGKRLLWLDEGFSSSSQVVMERIKAETGGMDTRGEQKGVKGKIAFPRTWTLLVCTNELPDVSDPAVRKRVKLLVFNPPSEAGREALASIMGDDEAAGWLADEGGAVLARAMEAFAELVADGTVTNITVPLDLAFLLDTVQAEQDPLKFWLATAAEPVDAKDGAASGDLYDHFRRYVVDKGVLKPNQVPAQGKWARRLTNEGYPSTVVRQGDEVVRLRPLRLRDDSWADVG